MHRIKNDTNPGSFSKEEYYGAKGIKYGFEKMDCEIGKVDNDFELSLFDKAGCFARRRLYSVKASIEGRLKLITDGESFTIYKGILIGDKSELSREIKYLYKLGGISHILAISSLHITLIGSLLWGILKKLGVPVYRAGIISVFFVGLYGIMTGFGIASIRAVIMMIIMVTGTIIGRDKDLLTTLAVAFLITNIFEPARITESAGIMSFSAIFGVACGNYVIRNILKYPLVRSYKKKHKIKWKLISALIYQTSIQLTMLPVTVSIYYEVFPYSFFLNLVVVPLMTLVVLSGFLGIILSIIFGVYGTKLMVGISGLAMYPGCKLLILFKTLCKAVERLPFNSINVGSLKPVQIIVYYMLFGLMLLLLNYKAGRRIREKLYKKRGIMPSIRGYKRLVFFLELMVSCLGLIIFVVSKGFLNKEMIVFLDVGQGAASVIRTEAGTGFVFDGGSSTSSKPGEFIIAPAVRYMGISDIDYWFVSHSDKDHISGLIEILDGYDYFGIDIHNLVIYKNCEIDDSMEKIINYAERYGINVIPLEKGDKLLGKDFVISCLHPEVNFYSTDGNDCSLAISYESKKKSVLFTGDMGKEALDFMLGDKTFKEKSYDYVMIPHHGSKNSLCDELYYLCKNGTAVISSGSGNRYGHPHQEVLESLASKKIKTWRTDKQGALIVR